MAKVCRVAAALPPSILTVCYFLAAILANACLHFADCFVDGLFWIHDY